MVIFHSYVSLPEGMLGYANQSWKRCIHREVKMVLKPPVTSQQHQHQRLGIPAASDSSPGFLAFAKNGGRREKCPGSLHLAFPLDSAEWCLFDVSYGFPMDFLWIPYGFLWIFPRLFPDLSSILVETEGLETMQKHVQQCNAHRASVSGSDCAWWYLKSSKKSHHMFVNSITVSPRSIRLSNEDQPIWSEFRNVSQRASPRIVIWMSVDVNCYPNVFWYSTIP